MLDATHGTGAYTEKVTKYDKNGNIEKLQRYGNGLIDDLTYTYNGNQLTKVEDATGNAAGFNNGASTANEYTYDHNGNLTKDSNKGITNIAYNCLNLPSTVTFSDGSTIVYSYAADGTKLRTVHTISGTTTQKDYCANVVYENGVQKLLLTEEGYVDLSASTLPYYYYLKDHQGNNRVVIDKNGDVKETNHYYPFGGVFASTDNVQPYKYNGKVLDTKKGLNWYDYGARHYDATLGRWLAVDPLAEKYYALSPFVYCNNLPIRYIDPTGKDWKDAWPHLQKSFSGNVSLGFRVGISANISSLKVGADINAGSVELGNDGYKLTQGVGFDVGPFGVNINKSVYHVDDYLVARKKSVSGNIIGITIENDKTTTYDSTGKYFKEVGNKTESQMNYSVGLSATAGFGVDVSIDLSEIWNFVIKLFE